MEDKQLNYHQPLPSLRRSPSPAPSEMDINKRFSQSLPEIYPICSCESELKLGHIRNAGTVPFVREQHPGIPKDECKAKNENQSPVIVPKLPFGRIMKIGKQTSINLSSSQHRKEVSCCLSSMSILKENDSEVESTRDVMESGDSDTTGGDEECSGTPNTISRTEPFFPNGSFSGLSDLDGSSLNRNGNFSLDPQTRDFMIARFLPAAKAMTNETPQYAPGQQLVVEEQTRPISKVVIGDKSLLQYGPNVNNEGEDSDDDEDDYDVQGQFPANARGLLPNFCLKNSYIPLNPLLGMHGKMREQLSTGGRPHESSSSAGSCCQNVNEAAVFKQRPIRDLQFSKQEDTVGSENQPDQHDCFFPRKLEGSALYRRLQGGGMPSPEIELLQSISYAPEKPLSSHDYELPRYTSSEHRVEFRKPLSSHDYELPGYSYFGRREAFRNPGEVKNAEETGVNNSGKGPRTFEELLAGTKRIEEVDTGSPMIEKTLNVDNVKKVKPSCTYSDGLDTHGLPNLNTDVLKDVEECKTMESTHPTDSTYKDVKEENTKIIAQKHVDNFSAPSLPDRSNLSRNFLISEVSDNENEFEGHQPLKAEDEEKPKGSYSNFLIPPPLPKPPSDSWLSRTLLSLASKTPSSQEHITKGVGPGNHTLTTSSVDHKWETIVKSTRDHRRREPLATIPET